MIKTIKQKLLNYLLRSVYPISELDKIVTIGNNATIYIDGIIVDKHKLADLKSEAYLLKNTAIWSILCQTLKDRGQKIIFNESKDFQDVLNGKMILYTVNIQEKIIENIIKAS